MVERALTEPIIQMRPLVVLGKQVLLNLKQKQGSEQSEAGWKDKQELEAGAT